MRRGSRAARGDAALRARPGRARLFPTSAASCPVAASGRASALRAVRRAVRQGRFRPRFSRQGRSGRRSRRRRGRRCSSATRCSRCRWPTRPASWSPARSRSTRRSRAAAVAALIQASDGAAGRRGQTGTGAEGARLGVGGRSRRPDQSLLVESIGFGIGEGKCDTCCAQIRRSDLGLPRAGGAAAPFSRDREADAEREDRRRRRAGRMRRRTLGRADELAEKPTD